MATIIKHKKTGEEYILLGTGFGATDYAGKDRIDTSENEKERYPLLCVCNEKGKIGWVYSEDFKVVQVAMESPADIYALRKKRVYGS